MSFERVPEHHRFALCRLEGERRLEKAIRYINVLYQLNPSTIFGRNTLDNVPVGMCTLYICIAN